MTIDEFKRNIAPHMDKGWVAMDKDEKYYWYAIEPCIDIDLWTCYRPDYAFDISKIFTIEPVKDWTKSLIEVGR